LWKVSTLACPCQTKLCAGSYSATTSSSCLRPLLQPLLFHTLHSKNQFAYSIFLSDNSQLCPERRKLDPGTKRWAKSDIDSLHVTTSSTLNHGNTGTPPRVRASPLRLLPDTTILRRRIEEILGTSDQYQDPHQIWKDISKEQWELLWSGETALRKYGAVLWTAGHKTVNLFPDETATSVPHITCIAGPLTDWASLLANKESQKCYCHGPPLRKS
jgi:hypothetical protein